MEWLNASVTFLNSSAMRRSTMIQRGVWLTLMSYCIQQENGGRIKNCADWSDWDWMNVCGIKKRDVQGDSLLWHWEDGAELAVFGYPVEKEAEVRARREAGKRGGLERARRASSNHASIASSSASMGASTEGERERKGNRKGRGTEGEAGRAEAAGAHPTLPEWLAFAAETFPDWPPVDAESAWAHYEACGWVMGERGKKPVRDWRACVRTCAARWAREHGAAGTAPAGFTGDAPYAHTGGLPDVGGENLATNEPVAAAAQEANA
jgi:hypothetical protein